MSLIMAHLDSSAPLDPTLSPFPQAYPTTLWMSSGSLRYPLSHNLFSSPSTPLLIDLDNSKLFMLKELCNNYFFQQAIIVIITCLTPIY